MAGIGDRQALARLRRLINAWTGTAMVDPTKQDEGGSPGEHIEIILRRVADGITARDSTLVAAIVASSDDAIVTAIVTKNMGVLLVGASAIDRDITQRKWAEQELAARVR